MKNKRIFVSIRHHEHQPCIEESMKRYIIAIFALSYLSLSPCYAVGKIQDLEKKYFKLLDYYDPEKRSLGLKLEKHLCDKANTIVEFVDKNPNFEPPKGASSKEHLGMYLAYTALYLMNHNNGFVDGVIPYEQIISQMKIDDGNDGKKEVYARYELAHKYFTLAEKLAPHDDRIQGWHLSSLFRYQKFQKGFVEEWIMDKIVEHVQSQPIFHLFNALTMNSDYSFGEKRENILFKTTDFLTSKESPCAQLFFRTGEAKKCNTTNRTPFAYQGVTTYMGDVYLKEAFKVHTKDPSLAENFAKKAKQLYARVDWFIFKPKAKHWKMYEYLPARKEIADEIVHGNYSNQGFFKSNKFLDTYSCVSCHQNGRVKGSLKIVLPEDSLVTTKFPSKASTIFSANQEFQQTQKRLLGWDQDYLKFPSKLIN